MRCKKKAVTLMGGALWSWLLLMLTACDLDGYRLRERAGDAGTLLDGAPSLEGGGIGVGGPVACEPGSHRCDPAAPRVLQVCDPLSVTGWVNLETCHSAEACDVGIGQCRVCVPGEHWCDSWRLKECNSSGTGWTLLQECAAPEHCDSRAAQCSTCLSSEAYCSGSTLLSCNDNRDGYTATECQSPDDCNITSMACRQCVAGELQCNRHALMRCSDDKKWEVVEECVTPALCELSRERQLADPTVAVSCAVPVCEAGAFKCSEEDGRTLLGCPPGRDGWHVVDVCATAELCNAGAGECIEPACAPGNYQCSETALQVCSPDGMQWETLEVCAASGQCNTTARSCVACTPGAMQCSGSNLQRCTEEASWETVDDCVSAALCVVDAAAPGEGHCTDAACERGQYRCRDQQLEMCDTERDGWELVATCASGDLCNPIDGRCDLPGCPSAGAYRCRGERLETCADDRSGWQLVQTCGNGTACDLETQGCAAACPDQRFRCNGPVPEECVTEDDGSFHWQAAAAPCATDELCRASGDGASCEVPVCGGSLANFRCDPDEPQRIQRCNNGRAGWETVQTCMGQSLCDPGPEQEGPAQCDICAPGTWSCSNGVLSRCRQDGQRDEILETCRDQDHCVVSDAGSDGYCLRCDSDQTQCTQDGNLTVCGDDRRSWVPSQSCDPQFGCQDTPDGHDYCNVCSAPGEVRCNGNTLQACDQERRQITESTSCQNGCESVRGDDYCRECEPNHSQCSESDSMSRRVCSAVGLWETHACPDGAPCYDAGNADYCGACTPGSVACFSPTQQQLCAMSGTPGQVSDCPPNEPICLAATGKCVGCAPGTPPRCSGAVGSAGREVCGDQGGWQRRDCSGDTPVCHAGNCVACAPSATQCTGGRPQDRRQCSAAGAWQAANCNSSDVCWEGDCVECNPTTAAPRCMSSGGPTREVCIDGQWRDQSCDGQQVCVDGACLACDPASQSAQCLPDTNDAARRICRDGGWLRSDCAAPTPVCRDDGRCVCEEGERRCADNGGRQRCAGGVWIDDACAQAHCRDGECVECVDDDDCPGDFPACVAGACECDVGDERCTATGAHQVCSGSTWDNAPCAGDSPTCDSASGACVCSDGARRCESGARQECVAGSWQEIVGSPCTECSSSAECSGATPICDGVECVPCDGDCPGGLACSSAGRCVECTSLDVGACGGDTPVCSDDNVCVECTPTNMGACDEDTPVCDDDNVCRGCQDQTECGSLLCDTASGRCVACLASGSMGCAGDEVCVDGECVQCFEDSDCDDNAPICDGNMCRGCEANSECPSACLPNGRCAECADDADCGGSTPLCVDGQCRGCEAGDCSAGVCNSDTGVCEPCSGDNCAGYCQDAQCVACSGLLCPDGRVCSSGQCLPCVSLDGGTGATCPSGICLAGICL